jgi:hypothetical protein
MHRNGEQFRCQVQKVRERISAGELAFIDCLTGETVQAAIDHLGIVFRQRIYTPWVTLWLFIFQTMSGVSCADAVSRLIAHRASRNQEPCSPETKSYCTARTTLPETFYQFIFRDLGYRALRQAPKAWKFFGRDVKAVDGTTVSMPETEENCEEYPLADPARAGLSFPLARLLVMFSLSVGVALEVVISPYRGKRTGEYALLRQLVDKLEPNDILLGDGGFCSYCHLAELQQREVDFVVRAEHSHLANFDAIKRLGKHDMLYLWSKPKGKPDTFDRSEFNALPNELRVRVVTVHVDKPGFRTKQFDILTTLTDHKLFRPDDLADLYFCRWQAELYLRDIKATLGMDQLKCKSPETVRREIYTHLIAYNLIRIQMAKAANLSGILPQVISFTSSVNTILQFQAHFTKMSEQVLAVMLATIAHRRVGKQPDRFEPRAVKRRSPHDLLTKPREQARKALLKNDLSLTP